MFLLDKELYGEKSTDLRNPEAWPTVAAITGKSSTVLSTDFVDNHPQRCRPGC
jgi:hypothetical protein